jgi:hypothetical protein
MCGIPLHDGRGEIIGIERIAASGHIGRLLPSAAYAWPSQSSHQSLPREQLVGSAQLAGAARAMAATLLVPASRTGVGVVFSMAPMTSAQTPKQATNSAARICDSNFMTSLRDWQDALCCN